jgi:hypothetical protein
LNAAGRVSFTNYLAVSTRYLRVTRIPVERGAALPRCGARIALQRMQIQERSRFSIACCIFHFSFDISRVLPRPSLGFANARCGRRIHRADESTMRLIRVFPSDSLPDNLSKYRRDVSRVIVEELAGSLLRVIRITARNAGFRRGLKMDAFRRRLLARAIT